MRILIINTSERTGGAAVAANRLMEALKNNGVKAKMLVRDKETDSLTVCGLSAKWRTQWNFLWERFVIWVHLHFQREHLFEMDIANCGVDITKMPEFEEADVIHLHWVNQGMLSLENIRKILATGKPVVWTMHDIWPATAICHYARGCEAFHTECKHCKLLPGSIDLANKVWKRKQHMLEGQRVTYVACSKWLQGEARRSGLLKGQRVECIPNPIDTHVFRPSDKQAARERLNLPADRRLILFVSQRVTNVNKGMDYLIEACRLMSSQYPDIAAQADLVILGGHAEEMTDKLPMKVWPLGYVNDRKSIVDVYNAADVFVLPSLSENLPNTIMEAMACGVPCVGFKVGGIPEEIDHQKNGYVARYRDAQDLADGIHWVLSDCDYEAVSRAAVTKVAHNYSQTSVAMRYIEVYNEALAVKHYKL